jgi:hypothetical protein
LPFLWCVGDVGCHYAARVFSLVWHKRPILSLLAYKFELVTSISDTAI